MDVEQRIRLSLLVERINEHKALSEKLGLEDTSKFHGEIRKEEGEMIC